MTRGTVTADELLLLPEAGLVDIGAHPMSHPALSTLGRAEQRAQIQTSKTMLEQILNDRVISFAYPLGSGTPETVRAADPLRLPRPCGRDNDGETFARWLRWWLGR
jgi:peptidoglycan/xylan/chitin deacetylase (PgdA/CDA1 family)